MKRLIGFAAILVALFLSGSVFAQDLVFEVEGKKYEAAPSDLLDSYDFDDAKAACERFVDPDDLNGDWFLPSKDELNAMYEQLHKKDLGGFANDYYWSSSEGGGNSVWIQYFSSGNQYYVGKGSYGRVRCVRAL